MQYTYLIIDLTAVSVPLVFSFHPRIRFIEQWREFLPSLSITAFLFIVWDSLFTKLGVWSFNYEYLTGINIFNLPIEEIFFFFCIPYACLFTYYCISLWRKERSIKKINPRLMLIPVLILLLIGIYYYNYLYTSFTFIALALFLIVVIYIFKVKWIKNYFLACLLLIAPFLICNGILTGSGLNDAIVKYNSAENLGIRILTIPVEDLFYGMLLIGSNVYLFERLLDSQIKTRRRMV